MTAADIPISVDDPARDKNIIIQQFMRELCRRDDQANRNMDYNNPNPNVFSIREIWKPVLAAYSLEKVVDVLRGYEMIDDPLIELVDQERREKVRLTSAGRARCGGFGL